MSTQRVKTADVTVKVVEADEKRLREAGFAPVVRWVDTRMKSDVPLKTVEALTLLDRREAAAAMASSKKGKR